MPTVRTWRPCCTSGTANAALILRHMVEDGRLVRVGQQYYLPEQEEVL